LGAGSSFYVGTRLERTGMAWLLGRACERAGIQALDLPTGVEAVRRVGDGASYLVLLNHTAESVAVALTEAATDLTLGRTEAGPLTLPPYGVAFLRLHPAVDREVVDREVADTERAPVKGA